MALAKSVNGEPIVMRILLDTCCTGKGLIAEKTVKDLGLKIKKAARQGTYTSVGGKFKSLGFVVVPDVMLPVLSQDRSFSMELEVVPDDGHMSYSLIMGQVTMHNLKIDTKVSTHEIIWEDIHRPMVNRNYWSKGRMKEMIPVWNRYLERLDAKKNGESPRQTLNTNMGSSTAEPGLARVRSAARSVSFAQPMEEELVHFTDQEEVVGSGLVYDLDDLPTIEEINSNQVLVAPEYKAYDLDD